MNLTKPELRQRLKAKRLALSQAERAAKSGLIVKKLREAIDWSDVDSVHIYEPLLDLGEVDVSKFTSSALFFTSRKVDGDWRVVPIKGSAQVPDNFEVIIVPMLGFDSSLHRIGYGGGYYDKFLATQPTAKKIGVCFAEGRVESLPAEPHDIKLDMVITD